MAYYAENDLRSPVKPLSITLSFTPPSPVSMTHTNHYTKAPSSNCGGQKKLLSLEEHPFHCYFIWKIYSPDLLLGFLFPSR